MDRLGLQEGEPIEHRWLSKSIEGAQKRVEEHNFDIRKSLLEYDDVMNQQRKTIYALRRQVLAAGAGFPLVEYDDDPKTFKKVRTERWWSGRTSGSRSSTSWRTSSSRPSTAPAPRGSSPRTGTSRASRTPSASSSTSRST